MINEEKELINNLKCEEICALETTGSLKNNSTVKKIKTNKQCYC